jgi:PAS domain S-box-containing protein
MTQPNGILDGQNTEERYRALFDRSLEAVFLCDLEGHFLDANLAALKLFGYRREDISNLDFSSMGTNDQDLGRAYQSLRQLIATGIQKETAEYQLKRKNGSFVWVELLSSLVLHEDRAVAVQGIARDITGRKQAEAALAESEARFRAIFEQAGIGMKIVHYGSGHIQQCNRTLARMLGYTVDELCHLTVKDISHPEDYIKDSKQWLEMIKGKFARFQIEKRYCHRDGKIIWGRLTATLVRDAGGKPLFLIGMVEDITEQRKAREQLEQSAALMRIAGKVARLGAWTIELPSRKLTWSDETCIIHDRQPGYQPSLEEGVSMFPPEHQAEVRRQVDACEREGTPYDFEVPKNTAKGRQIWVRCIGEAARDPNGKIVRLQGAFQDVTERKKLEEQFLRSQRMESIGTLAGGIAHDLNNVLAPILMSIQLLKLDKPGPDRLKLLATLEANTIRGADMVRQVLSFTRGVEGRRCEVQVVHLLREIKRITDETFPKNIQVRLNLPTKLWTVSGDPTQLHQVLLNLCINARDAMPDGGTLSLSAENANLDAHYAGLEPDAKVGRHVVVQVEDTGTGMPPEVMDKIFDPFFTTKKIGKGTGLGLSTSLAIVKSHDGFIRVYSEPTQGSRFSVFLPAHEKSVSDTEHLLRPDLPQGNNELVLVVDDEISVREITRQTLETYGYRAILASDGAEAVATYASRKNDIAVVLTDMMMPVMGGQATIQVLRKMNPKVPIIAASGLNMDGKATMAGQDGIKHFLPKPFSAEVLLKALQRVLHQQE